MTTLLERPLRRALQIGGDSYVLVISPEGLKLTRKGRRKGVELTWESVIGGEAALALALNASLGQLEQEKAARPPDKAVPTAASRPATRKLSPVKRKARLEKKSRRE